MNSAKEINCYVLYNRFIKRTVLKNYCM